MSGYPLPGHDFDCCTDGLCWQLAAANLGITHADLHRLDGWLRDRGVRESDVPTARGRTLEALIYLLTDSPVLPALGRCVLRQVDDVAGIPGAHLDSAGRRIIYER